MGLGEEGRGKENALTFAYYLTKLQYYEIFGLPINRDQGVVKQIFFEVNFILSDKLYYFLITILMTKHSI